MQPIADGRFPIFTQRSAGVQGTPASRRMMFHKPLLFDALMFVEHHPPAPKRG